MVYSRCQGWAVRKKVGPKVVREDAEHCSEFPVYKLVKKHGNTLGNQCGLMYLLEEEGNG